MFNLFSYLPTRSSSLIESSSQDATLRERDAGKVSLEMIYSTPIRKKKQVRTKEEQTTVAANSEAGKKRE